MSPAALLRDLNALGLLAVAAVLATALLLQLVTGELPCPLCLLQRVGFVALGFGLLLNARFGPSPMHYGLVLVAALFGAAAAGRQVLLHILPGSGAYGDPLLGLHLYTWSLLLFLLAIAGTALLLLMEGQFERGRDTPPNALQRAAIAVYLLATLLTGLAAFAQCGPGECADDPTGYWLLERVRP